MTRILIPAAVVALIVAASHGLGAAGTSPTTAPTTAPTTQPDRAKAVLNVTDADDGKTVSARDAKAVEVRLSGNPTTGYSWFVAKVDGPALRPSGEVRYEKGAAAAGRVGAGGTFVAAFDVAEPGKATVVMEYRRPWEKDKPAAKTFTVTVEVADGATGR